MGAPSSGGVAVLQLLGMLARFQLNTLLPTSADAVHLQAKPADWRLPTASAIWPTRIFVAVLQAGLIAPDYLGRAQPADRPATQPWPGPRWRAGRGQAVGLGARRRAGIAVHHPSGGV